jgi:hypothetical protein
LENLDLEVRINIAWETVRENTKISAKDIVGYYELKKYVMVRRMMFRIMRSEESSQITVVEASKRHKRK